jgi:thiol-disulfide isomerase/thioredoxin
MLQVLSDDDDVSKSHDVDDRIIWCWREAEIVNGVERISVMVGGGSQSSPSAGGIQFPEYDSSLSGHGVKGSKDLHTPLEYMHTGIWEKIRGGQTVSIPYSMKKADSIHDRFDPIADAAEPAAFSGRWSVDFESSDELAIGTFTVDAHQIASGTFLTTTGDYRYLAGRVDGDLMRLSTFDGAHAFLFHARMQDDGTIAGDFWSGNWHHETWTGVRDDNAQLPDAFEQTTITDEQALEELVFKDTNGTPTRVLDALDATKAKARVIEIFGTWCPNCADASRELVSLKQKYGGDLGVVGLAFEITEDFERSSQQVQRHHAHIGSDWQVLIAGLSDKAKATKTLGFLDQVRSYPTLVFLNSENEVQAVYSGFSGPATGDAYTEQRLRFEALIEGMIAQ